MDTDYRLLEVYCEKNKEHLTTKLNSVCKPSNENNKLHLRTELNRSGCQANNENNVRNESNLMIQDICNEAQEFSCENSLFNIKNPNRLALTQSSHSAINKSITRIFPYRRKSDVVIKNNLISEKNKALIGSSKPIKSKLTQAKSVSIQQELRKLDEKESAFILSKKKLNHFHQRIPKNKLISILPKSAAFQTKTIEEEHKSRIIPIINLTQEGIFINCTNTENCEKIFPVAIHRTSDFQPMELLHENKENKNETFILGI